MRIRPSTLTGERFREVRKRQGWTQIKLADALGCSRRTVQRYEAGTLRIPLQTAILLSFLTQDSQPCRQRA